MEMMFLTEAQCHALCDMGYFNTTIYGYMVEALEIAGFSREDIRKAIGGMRTALDEMTAAEAEEAFRTF